MYPKLIETIKIQNGTIGNLAYHNARLNRTRRELFGCFEPIDLHTHIAPPKAQQLYRCRITYAQEIETIEYIPYTPKEQKDFRVAQSDIDYPYKYANRETLDRLKAQFAHCDDIIVVHKGVLKDTTIANIAFFDGKIWWTPKEPLLAGTMRQYLLDNRKIQAKELKIDEISSYHGFAIMNAMVGFKVIKDYTIRS
ncbi:MAG: hypothetical protein KU28_11800 [Sulfurovum sp. PC08-66]|nr:MAG: hypothetical protein KU28_11800 [Sulfurovum sp. PC08-66]